MAGWARAGAVGLGAMAVAVPVAAAVEVLPGGVVRAPAAVVVAPEPVPDPRSGVWEVRGRVAPQPVATGLRLSANTTVVSPPFAVPAGAQTLAIRVAAPGSGALVRVAALVEGQAGERELAVREPTPRGGRVVVGVGDLAGRTVRLVIDPAPALGASVVLGPVGPFRAPLPGWLVTEGAPEAVGRGASARLRVREEPVRAVAPPTPARAGAVALLVQVRGQGRVVASAGGRAVSVAAGPRWRDVVVPVARVGRVPLALRLVPAGRGVEVRQLGAVRRRIAPVGPRLRGAGAVRRVVGVTRPTAPGLAVRVVAAGGRTLGRAVTDRAGRFVVRLGPGPRPARVLLGSDRLRLGGAARVR